MMVVTDREKEEFALSALNMLVSDLIINYGHSEEFWLNTIYSSAFIIDLKNVDTGYWGEGMAFHKHKLLMELKAKGISNSWVCSITKIEVSDTCWLTTHILYGMEKWCHMSVSEVSEATGKTQLIKFLLENYETLHQEGMLANLQSVQKILKAYGIDIEIDYSLAGKKGMPS